METHRPVARILVVDDNAQNRALARETLEDESYEVILASGGAEALAAFEHDAPDCVLLDVRMPGMDGPAVCKQIRALPSGGDVPIVFLTAQRDVETFDRALSAGGDDFLTKPVQPAELVLRVQAALKLRQVKAELREHYALVRRQRDDLMRLQLQKERLSQFLVHDLKNPVSTLDLSAQMLLRDPELSNNGRRIVQRMRSEARTLLHMILNLLDISRSDEGGLTPRRESLQLADLIDDVLNELQLKAQTANSRLVRAGEPTAAFADPSLLRRVLENLVENAIRHSPEDSTITVTHRRADDGVVLCVCDQGAGVAPELRAKVFEPFVQLEHADGSVERTGRGLGLAFCKIAVEAHGGRIWIDDSDRGAAFCISLPDSS